MLMRSFHMGLIGACFLALTGCIPQQKTSQKAYSFEQAMRQMRKDHEKTQE